MDRHATKLAITIVAIAASAAAQTPLGSAFTYQGTLENAGVPASGTYDMRFRLFDASLVGTQIGATICRDGVIPDNGVFTVSLDFGVAAFDGNARWLEVSVRADAAVGNCATGAYTTLAPRQPLTATPYALYALGGPGQAGFWAANGTHIYKTNTGNVGVGTTTPAVRLHVTGGSDVSLGGGGFLVLGDTAGASVGFDNNEIMARSGTSASSLYLNHDGGDVYIGANAPGTFRVGIGTDTPGGKLGVGTDTGTAMFVSSLGNAGPVANFTSGLNPDFGGNVLNIITVGNSNSQAIYAKQAGDGATGAGDCAVFEIDNTGSTAEAVEAITNGTGDAIQAWNNGNGRAGYFSITSTLNGSPALYTRTSGPGWALWADGPTYINGLARVDVLEITGADLAERFPTTDDHAEIKPGMVMEIDPDHAGKLRIARGEYNRRVAGVVSGAGSIPTGTILGNMPGSEGAPAVALSGRVHVFCIGEIEPGDLLTTSDKPGYAMRADDAARSRGAIIGKAMSRVDSSTGMVLMLVQPQ